MNTEDIRTQLRELHLKTAAAELEDVLAHQSRTVPLDWLSTLLSREIDARRESAVQYRIKLAEFPEVTSLESFDWAFNPDIDRVAVEELATLAFVERNEIALFLGKPGTGKTHLALALGVGAVYRGHRVFCSSVKRSLSRSRLPVPATRSTYSSRKSSPPASGSSTTGASSP